MITRRTFIKNTGAGLFLTAVPFSANSQNRVKKFELTAKKAVHSFEKNGKNTDLWLFNNNCPLCRKEFYKTSVFDVLEDIEWSGANEDNMNALHEFLYQMNLRKR